MHWSPIFAVLGLVNTHRRRHTIKLWELQRPPPPSPQHVDRYGGYPWYNSDPTYEANGGASRLGMVVVLLHALRSVLLPDTSRAQVLLMYCKYQRSMKTAEMKG
jgi:hypothetical protein